MRKYVNKQISKCVIYQAIMEVWMTGNLFEKRDISVLAGSLQLTGDVNLMYPVNKDLSASTLFNEALLEHDLEGNSTHMIL